MSLQPKRAMNKAIFLDRDGTIIEEKGYICRLTQSKIFPFAYEAVRIMNRLSFKVLGITNQSSIARGICSKEDIENFHSDLIQKFHEQGATIDQIYYCPYHIEGVIELYKKMHHWRKPSPGMIFQAATDYELDLSECYMMGDDVCDIQAGFQAGCKTVLVLTGKGQGTETILKAKKIIPNMISPNILAAIKTIANFSEKKDKNLF